MRARHPLIALSLLVGGCIPQQSRVPPPAPPPPPAPRPTPVATPAPTGTDWRDWPLTSGTWVYARDDRGSIARFGLAGTDPVLTLRCDLRERRIYLSRAGTVASPLTIRTTSTTRAVQVQPTGGAIADVAASFAATDPLLDAIGFSRGRFIVEQAGGPPLVIPAWAEVERVTEDCRG